MEPETFLEIKKTNLKLNQSEAKLTMKSVDSCHYFTREETLVRAEKWNNETDSRNSVMAVSKIRNNICVGQHLIETKFKERIISIEGFSHGQKSFLLVSGEEDFISLYTFTKEEGSFTLSKFYLSHKCWAEFLHLNCILCN